MISKKLFSKLNFQTLAPSLALLVILTLSFTYLGLIISKRFADLQEHLTASNNATRSLLLISKLRGDSKERLLLYRYTHETKYLSDLNELEMERSLQIARLQEEVHNLDPDDILIDTYVGGAKTIKSLEQVVLEAIASRRELVASRLFDDYSDLFDINSAILADLHALMQSRLSLAEGEMKRLLQRFPSVLFAMFAFGTLSATGIARFYGRRVLNPLAKLHQGLSSVSEGNFGVQLEIPPSATEIKEMLSDFNQMTLKLKQMTGDLTKAREEAMHAANVKSEFLSNMSHEIRTPLNVILGLADLIRERKLDRETSCEIDVLRKSGGLLLNIVNDILDYARLESGRITVESEIFDLHQSINNIVQIIEPLARSKSLKMAAQISLEVPRLIYGDRHLLEQALLNLANNAIKFTSEGGTTIQARVRQSNSPQRLEISVIDTGIGIPNEKIQRLFERFEQADSSITRSYGGTGLGLAIVKQITSLLDGDIWVSSSLGVGSTFTLSIPFRPVSEQELSNGPALLEPVSAGAFTGFSRIPNILVADDSEDNRFVIQHFLQPTGANIVEAENGLNAIAAYKENDFDVILMDIQMPGVDGYQATREIREHERQTNRRHTPVIAVTAFALKEEVERSYAQGCDAHVTKPIHKTDLLNLIQKFISTKRIIRLANQS